LRPYFCWSFGLAHGSRSFGRVLFLTLRYSGLRVNELVNLRTAEVDLNARRISLVGKLRKPRVVPIPRVLAPALREYLDEVRPNLPRSAYLFANSRGNRRLRVRHGSRALQDLVKKWDFGGGGRSALPPPMPSQLCHQPRAPGRGRPRRPAPDGSLQHRDYEAGIRVSRMRTSSPLSTGGSRKAETVHDGSRRAPFSVLNRPQADSCVGGAPVLAGSVATDAPLVAAVRLTMSRPLLKFGGGHSLFKRLGDRTRTVFQPAG
jgi:hypothetical protein